MGDDRPTSPDRVNFCELRSRFNVLWLIHKRESELAVRVPCMAYELDAEDVGEYEAGMATVRKSITLTDQQDAWISAQVDAGRYTDDSEAIRDLIRHAQERSSEIETIRTALIEGEESGVPEPFDFVAFKRHKTAEHG